MRLVRAGVQVLLPKLALHLSCHLVRHSWSLWGRFRWVSAERGNGLGHAKTRNFPPYSCEEPLHKSTLRFGRCQLTNVLWPTMQHRVHSAPPVPGRWAMPWRQPAARAQGFALAGDSSGLHHPPSFPPHLVPRKPPHLQQLCLLGGVKSPAELQKRPKLFCAPAVPSCALGMHCSTSWMPKLTEAKEAEEPVSKTLGVPGVLASSTDHPGAGMSCGHHLHVHTGTKKWSQESPAPCCSLDHHCATTPRATESQLDGCVIAQDETRRCHSCHSLTSACHCLR